MAFTESTTTHTGARIVWSAPHRIGTSVDPFGRIDHHAGGHVLYQRVVSYNGRSVWGYRCECEHCGTVEENPLTSSVSAEDGPPLFAHEHAHCS